MTIPRRSPQWFAGYDKQCAWLKYGADPDWMLSLVRCWDTPGIELAIRVSDPAATNLDIPGYAPFSMEAGLSDSMAVIEGVGMLEQHPRRKVVFRAGNMDFDDPYSLFVVRRWLATARPPVTIHVGQLALSSPADPSALNALSVLATKQRHFENAVLSNPVYVPDAA